MKPVQMLFSMIQNMFLSAWEGLMIPTEELSSHQDWLQSQFHFKIGLSSWSVNPLYFLFFPLPLSFLTCLGSAATEGITGLLCPAQCKQGNKGAKIMDRRKQQDCSQCAQRGCSASKTEALGPLNTLRSCGSEWFPSPSLDTGMVISAQSSIPSWSLDLGRLQCGFKRKTHRDGSGSRVVARLEDGSRGKEWAGFVRNGR